MANVCATLVIILLWMLEHMASSWAAVSVPICNCIYLFAALQAGRAMRRISFSRGVANCVIVAASVLGGAYVVIVIIDVVFADNVDEQLGCGIACVIDYVYVLGALVKWLLICICWTVIYAAANQYALSHYTAICLFMKSSSFASAVLTLVLHSLWWYLRELILHVGIPDLGDSAVSFAIALSQWLDRKRDVYTPLLGSGLLVVCIVWIVMDLTVRRKCFPDCPVAPEYPIRGK